MSGNAKFGIDIAADDLSAPGWKSAEARAKKFSTADQKRRAAADRADVKSATERRRRDDRLYKDAKDRARATGIGASGRGFAAAERAFGGGGVSAAVSGRLSGVAEAGSTLKSAFAAATHESAGLAEKLGLAATAGGVVVGAFVAAGLAAQKLASSFVEGGASTNWTAQTIGVSGEDLQSFQGSGERVGIDKGAAADALHGIASTLNDARFGRNNTALAAMNQLQIAPDYDKDGKADIMGFTKKLADAVSRQTNPQTQETIAGFFGAGGALNLLRQGSGPLNTRMADVKRFGAVQSNDDIAKAPGIFEKEVAAKQLGERGLMVAGRAGVGLYEKGLDAVNAAGQGMANGAPAAAAAGLTHSLVDGAIPAIHRFTSAMDGAGKGLAWRIEHLGERSRQDQVSPAGARGVMQVMPGTARDVAAKHGIAWSEDRYRNDPAYSRLIGSTYLDDLLKRYSGDEALATAGYNAGPGAVDRWIKRFGDPTKGQISDADFVNHIPGNGPHTYQETRDYVRRVEGSTKVDLHIHGLPAGTRVKATTAGGSVAIAKASVGSGSGP